MRTLTLIVLLLSALSFIGFGLVLTAHPIEILAMTDVHVSGPIADTEIRAFYGGLELALGGLILAWTVAPSRRRDALLLTAVSYGGIGLTRLGSMLVTGDQSSFLMFAVATELGFLIIATLLYRHTPASQSGR
ncbi:hypothetical protein C7S18_21035 [Ahniella affigens]|uniref:DUF4345 domain-containing protein n=1 Tax=Ahniella affigens TaxID=2021234 RepID=A0A2P1PXH2_9GAMM|nr:DUF4345 domain-containing protein [Ahniella affigens]AVP99504.1 hypothetical protein C7S18_21035 [Ahniella affigens]